MRKLMLAAVGLAALTAACGFAQAQDSHPHGGRGGFFMRADGNNDGVVTRQEFDAMRAAEFARLDANHDGQLSRDEMRAGRHWGGRGGRGGQRHGGGQRFDMLGHADANGDGNITREEFLARPNQMFDRLDANHDGVISATERQNAQDAMQQRMAQRRADRPNLDSNGDGMISRAEWDAMSASMFDRFDTNHDGRVTRDEVEAAHRHEGE